MWYFRRSAVSDAALVRQLKSNAAHPNIWGHQFHSHHIKIEYKITLKNADKPPHKHAYKFTPICGQICAHLRTQPRGIFVRNNSSYLYAAPPWSVLALASPLMELWSYGYNGWIRCINRCRNHSQGLSNCRWDLVYWWVKISPLNEQNFTPEF